MRPLRLLPSARVPRRALRLVCGALLAVVGAAAVGPGCGDPDTRDPRPVGTATSPRVVVLAPALARLVVALGAAGSVVGADQFSAELPELEDATALGGLFAPDLETLVDLKPSLVLGVESSQQQAFFEQLRARGTTVATFRLHSLDEVLSAFREVAELVERPREGAALVQRVRAELAAVGASVEGLARPRVALIVDRESLFVVGAGSFAHTLIERAGGENVFGDLAAAYPRVSLEALAARAPDVLLETTEPGSEAAAAARDYWARFGFVERVVALPRDEVVLPGPALARAARLLRHSIHPELEEGAATSSPGAGVRVGSAR